MHMQAQTGSDCCPTASQAGQSAQRQAVQTMVTYVGTGDLVLQAITCGTLGNRLLSLPRLFEL